jgi:prolyl-tRNA synthetase
MRQTQLFTKTTKNISKEEVSKNAQLLIKAGFAYKEMAGVYSYLPLGLRVMDKIKQIIREELNKAGCQEMVMTTLQSKEVWEPTNRWSDEVVDNWFRTQLKNGTELGLAFTHEEPIARIMSSFVSSYRDLPFSAYQFQTKFRNELRAKSGIMRGREFMMKDLYSFSKNEEEHNTFYESMKTVYKNIFDRLGIGEQTYLTMSSGEPFSKYSFEFQTLTDAGEDVIMYDESKKIAINKEDYSEEIFADFGFKKDEFNFKEATASEVGDIYSLGTKYAEAQGLKYTDAEGKEQIVFMGSYGIGISRVMGTIVEVLADEGGLIWPMSIAPYQVHLLQLGNDDAVMKKADELYKTLTDQGIEVLYDDRDASIGAQLGDADMIGLPIRLVISKKTGDKVEWKLRTSSDSELIESSEIVSRIKDLT